MHTCGHLIHGKVGSFNDQQTIPIIDPATGADIGSVSIGSHDTVNKAIQSATEAAPSWRQRTPQQRADILHQVQHMIEAHKDQICLLISKEHGKTLPDALGELKRGIENIHFAAQIPSLLKGEYSSEVSQGMDSWVETFPLGVVLGITPFNFPAMVPLWMWPLAIACGNTFILKPSEKDPSSAVFIAELAQKAGLPPGVLNVVNGDASTCQLLLEHPGISAVSFVGSTPVAKHIYAKCAANGKRVQALGGAKNHGIVMADAQLDHAVSAIVGAAYGSCGERCMAISVVVAVGATLQDRLVAKLSQAIATLKVGPYTDPEASMGPLISQQHREKIVHYIEQGVQDGAQLAVDGRQQTYQNMGFFLGPTLFDHVLPSMSIYQEEIFGPVLSVVRVDSLEEAIRLTNNHPFGNGASIFTTDGRNAHLFKNQTEVGMLGVNVPLPVPVSYHSFGGWKNSIFGDTGIYGPEGIRFYSRRKTITQKWPEQTPLHSSQFSFPSS